MKFKKYIERLKNLYNVEEAGTDIFKVSKNGRELFVTPNRMFDEAYLNDFFNRTLAPSYSGEVNTFSREVLGDDLSVRGSPFSLDERYEGNFGRIGEDDLLPKIGHKDLLGNNKKGVVRGSVPSPSDLFSTGFKEQGSSSEDNPFIKKDPISPLHGKKGPDPDHFKKPGDDDDKNKFLY